MKKLILALFVVVLASCSTTTTIYDDDRSVVVESIEDKLINGTGHRYILDAYQYTPELVHFRIYTNKPYNVGDRISINAIRKEIRK